jgi:hypothetical protein
MNETHERTIYEKELFPDYRVHHGNGCPDADSV